VLPVVEAPPEPDVLLVAVPFVGAAAPLSPLLQPAIIRAIAAMNVQVVTLMVFPPVGKVARVTRI